MCKCMYVYVEIHVVSHDQNKKILCIYYKRIKED